MSRISLEISPISLPSQYFYAAIGRDYGFIETRTMRYKLRELSIKEIIYQKIY